MIAFPVQGFGRQKIRRYITIGGDWDEFSAQYLNDMASVTVSANGTAKSYNQYIPYPAQSNNPLINYLVLIMQVSGYITLASGATSGSATVSVVMNGTTLYSTTISNTNNQLIINQIIPYSKFPSGYQQNGGNTLEIQVTLGTGASSVMITQVQYMFGILLNGGSSGLTVQIQVSQGVTYINDDPTLIGIQDPFGIGATIVVYDPFGISTGVAQFNAQNGTSVINTNGNATYVLRAFPAQVSNNQATATLTISVSANNSLLIAYFHIAIIVNSITIQKGIAHQLIWMYLNGGFPTDMGFVLNYVIMLPEYAIWSTVPNPDPYLNTQGYNWWFTYNNGWWSAQGYANTQYVGQIGNARMYKMYRYINRYILEMHHIADGYVEYPHYSAIFGNYANATPIGQNNSGYMLGRIVYVEVGEE